MAKSPISDAQKRTWHVLGFLFLRMGEFARARRLFRALLALDPFDLNARISLAHASIQLKDGEMALQTLAGLKPEDPIPGGAAILHLLLARSYHLLGEELRAKEEIQAFWQVRTREMSTDES